MRRDGQRFEGDARRRARGDPIAPTTPVGLTTPGPPTPPIAPTSPVALMTLLALAALLAAASAPAAGPWAPVPAAAQVAPTRGEAPDPPPLFASTAPLPVTLTADFTALRGDRTESPDRPGTLTSDGVEIPVEIRTRGSFRLDPGNCSFPPLRMDVDGDAAAGTAFEGQDDLKLVSSCRPERESWEELVVKEYLAYRSVQAVTDASFRVRLLEATFVDTGGDAPPETRIAFVIEEDEALARRLGATVYHLEEGKNLPSGAFDPVYRMTDAVAHYMVGNPDWSEVAGHNVEILDRSGVALAIPYDFDVSGVVNAPYAAAPPEYRLDSVRERYYRGWCENPLVTREVLARFRAAREEILGLWRDEPLLSEETRRRAAGYMEDFFDAIETDDRAERRFLRDCRTQATP